MQARAFEVAHDRLLCVGNFKQKMQWPIQRIAHTRAWIVGGLDAVRAS